MKDEEKAVVETAMAAMIASLKTTPNVVGAVLLVYDGERLLYEASTRTLKIAAALAREAAYAIHADAIEPPIPPGGFELPNLEELLAAVDPAEREHVRSMVTRVAMEGRPKGSRAIQALAPGPATCPGCDEPLRMIPTPTYRHESEGANDAFECTGCGGVFSRPAKVDA